jgi:hypothetical protein
LWSVIVGLWVWLRWVWSGPLCRGQRILRTSRICFKCLVCSSCVVVVIVFLHLDICGIFLFTVFEHLGNAFPSGDSWVCLHGGFVWYLGFSFLRRVTCLSSETGLCGSFSAPPFRGKIPTTWWSRIKGPPDLDFFFWFVFCPSRLRLSSH